MAFNGCGSGRRLAPVLLHNGLQELMRRVERIRLLSGCRPAPALGLRLPVNLAQPARSSAGALRPVIGGVMLLSAGLLAAAPRPTPRPMASLESDLMQQLAMADQQWRPQAQRLPGGATRYVYRKRPGDPDLSIDQIKTLMAFPPTFAWERQVIRDLWRRMGALGVQLQITQPRKPGAAGEWDPAARTLRIKPSVIAKGSTEFARVLNHEAIHVAQSCAAGGPGAAPRLLGLDQQLPGHLQLALQQPTYANARPRELQLEREAYANQDKLELGLSLINRHC